MTAKSAYVSVWGAYTNVSFQALPAASMQQRAVVGQVFGSFWRFELFRTLGEIAQIYLSFAYTVPRLLNVAT
jgi:hypothetical protein